MENRITEETVTQIKELAFGLARVNLEYDNGDIALYIHQLDILAAELSNIVETDNLVKAHYIPREALRRGGFIE